MEENPLSTEAMQVFQSASTNYTNQRYASVVSELAPLVKVYPHFLPINLLYIGALFAENRLDDAYRRTTQLLEEYEGNTQLLHEYGRICFRYGMKKRYRETLKRIIESKSPIEPIDVLMAKAALYREDKNFPAEYELHCEALKQAPDSYEIRTNMVFPLTMMGRLAEAESLLDRLLKDHPNSVRNLVQLGDVAWLKGDLSASEAAFKRAQLLSPRNAEIGAGLNRIYWRTGEIKKVFGVLKCYYTSKA